VSACYFNELHHGDNFAYDLESAARHYVLVMDLVEHYRCELDMNYLALRYEDLVADVEGQMRRLADWLGLDFDPCLTRPSNLGVAWSGNSTFGDGFSGVAQSEDQGLRTLSEAEVDLIRQTVAAFATSFGYDLSQSPAPALAAAERVP
jgi:hypothetical protein